MRRVACGGELMGFLALAGSLAAEAADDGDPGGGTLRGRVLATYTREAEGYAMFRDAGHSAPLVLRREPIAVWTNPTRAGGQDGAVFLWTDRGRPAVVGTIFSFPGRGKRTIDHEFLSLATAVIGVDRPGAAPSKTAPWSPRVPGPRPEAIPGAPAPAAAPNQRLAQMRDLAREFAGTTEDAGGRKWELRLLPRPLYRIEGADPDVVDGALFAFVTSAGTDPEAILLIEARKDAGSAGPSWHSALGRYTDLRLRMNHRGREVLDLPFLSGSNPEDSYHVLEDRIIPPIEPPAAAPSP